MKFRFLRLAFFGSEKNKPKEEEKLPEPKFKTHREKRNYKLKNKTK